MSPPLSQKNSTTRRFFLKQTAIAGAVLGFPAVLRAASPNSKVQVAAIGLGAMGYNDLHNIAGHAQVKYVGFCDVDETVFAKADTVAADVPHFRDFRVMLEQLGDTVDAVNVATPDHMHAPVAIEAMKRGKHVYCEKPLAHTVWEVRQMRLWAAKAGVVTQMGNQIHSAVAYRLAARLLQEGVIGRIRAVHSWVNPTGNNLTRLLEPPAPGPVPAGLDWNLWIGCAPMREYAPQTYHPKRWRDWQDFGGGALGDWGCHLLDPVFTALNLTVPVSVVADNSGINRHIWPTSQTIRYVFKGDELTAGQTLDVTWTDGGLRPERKLAQMPDHMDLPPNGSLFIGELGNLLLPHVAGPRLYPMEKFQGFAYPKDLKGINHWHRWVDAILEGGRTSAGFDYAGPLTEAVQLGNVATRMALRPTVDFRGGQTIDPKAATVLTWDAENFRITNNEAANSLLTKSYRHGWQVAPA